MTDARHCDHCGAPPSVATTHCAPPFEVRPHEWTGKHPADQREAIARIIDPEAFVPMEDVVGMRKAYAKADATPYPGALPFMAMQLVDSALPETRRFWRTKYFAATTAEADDPRAFQLVLSERDQHD